MMSTSATILGKRGRDSVRAMVPKRAPRSESNWVSDMPKIFSSNCRRWPGTALIKGWLSCSGMADVGRCMSSSSQAELNKEKEPHLPSSFHQMIIPTCIRNDTLSDVPSGLKSHNQVVRQNARWYQTANRQAIQGCTTTCHQGWWLIGQRLRFHQ